jgi:hypothetical protein
MVWAYTHPLKAPHFYAFLTGVESGLDARDYLSTAL